MLLGRVVKSNSHVDYVVQILAAGEVAEPPAPEEYAFGSFVRIAVEGGRESLIGVIYDTLLLNPAYGSLGPHLSGEPQLSTFSPDYLPETVTVVGIAILGQQTEEKGSVRYRQGVPPVAARIGAEARELADDEFVAFHQSEAGPSVAYLPRLAAMGNPAMPDLLNGLLGRLIDLFPDVAGSLTVLRSNLDWSTRLARGRQ